MRRCYGTYCFSGSCTRFTDSCSARQFSYYVFSRDLQRWAEPGSPARPNFSKQRHSAPIRNRRDRTNTVYNRPYCSCRSNFSCGYHPAATWSRTPFGKEFIWQSHDALWSLDEGVNVVTCLVWSVMNDAVQNEVEQVARGVNQVARAWEALRAADAWEREDSGGLIITRLVMIRPWRLKPHIRDVLDRSVMLAMPYTSGQVFPLISAHKANFIRNWASPLCYCR